MKILILLPECDYDPTESGVPWSAMVEAGHEVVFASPNGEPSPADLRLVETGFSLLSPFLMTRKPDISKYKKMAASVGFLAPLKYSDVNVTDYDALFIPGGHAPGMKTMIDSALAQKICCHFMTEDKPVAAVCHGVLLLARSRVDSEGGESQSVLLNRQTTALPASMELSAWAVTMPWLGSYYRTYPSTVEHEVKQAVGAGGRFDKGPFLPLRDSEKSHRFGFTVRDKNYLSARWPGDCNKFAHDWLALLSESEDSSEASESSAIAM